MHWRFGANNQCNFNSNSVYIKLLQLKQLSLYLEMGQVVCIFLVCTGLSILLIGDALMV